MSGAKFDYFYNPHQWEVTYSSGQRDEAVREEMDMGEDDIMQFSTLVKGPDFFAYRHVTEAHWFDDEKTDPMVDDWEPRYAESQEEAEALHKASLSTALENEAA